MAKYITCLFGDRYIGMLVALLESIISNDPQAKVEVYYQDINKSLFDKVSTAYKDVKFVQTSYNFSKDRVARISSKTLMWTEAIKAQPKDSIICILDVDTIVVRSPFHIISDINTDVVITSKNEQFKLNSGVMLVRAGDAANAFFDLWLEETVKILSNSHLTSIASSSQHPYGGADQMSLFQIINYHESHSEYQVICKDCVVKVRSVSTNVLNETNSVPIGEATHVIHFKGGWQQILLYKGRFKKARTREKCMPMYSFFLKTFQKGLERINESTSSNLMPVDLGVPIPLWYQQKSIYLRESMYFLYTLRGFGFEVRDLFKIVLKKLKS